MTTTRGKASVAAMLAVFSLVIGACGGSDDGADTTTAPVESTPSVSERGSTDPAVTEPPATEPPATEPAATEPPATEAPAAQTFTSEELSAALPTLDDLGQPWEQSEQPPVLDPQANSGAGIGSCGGSNGAGRALDLGSVGAVVGPLFFQGVDRHQVNAIAYSFPSDEVASEYLAGSAEANSCTEPVTWTRIEGSGDGEYDGFAPGFGDGSTWENSATYQQEPADVAGADEALITTTVTMRTNTTAGITFGETDTDKLVYTRHGSLVVITFVAGRCCSQGYVGLDDSTEWVPTNEDAVSLAETVSSTMVRNLGLS